MCSDDKVSAPEIVHLLAGLVRRSLVQMYTRKGTQRYNMLEMIRHYGRAKLFESGDEARMLKCRTDVFLDLVERSFDDGDRGEWPAILEAEYDNIRAVLTRTIDDADDLDSGLRMCGSLSYFGSTTDISAKHKRGPKKHLQRMTVRTRRRAKVLMAAGFFFGQTPGLDQDTDLRRSYFEESIRIWENVGDKRNLGITLVGYAFFLNRNGNYAKAIEVAERSVRRFARPTAPFC